MSEVEIIIGLDKSGRTTFLNEYLKMVNIKNVNTLIIIIGRGNKKIDSYENVKVKIFDSIFSINETKLLYLINIHNPQKIFIESEYVYIKHIDSILRSSLIKDRILITSRINIINTKFIKMILKSCMVKYRGNIIVINNYDKLHINKEDLYEIRDKNLNSFLFYTEDFKDLYDKFKYYKLINKGFYTNIFKYIGN